MAEGPLPTTTEELLRGLECPICQEHYKDPRILQCGHTLCFKPCLEQIVAGKQRFRCPECRTEHGVPTSGIDSFLKNIAISRQLDVRPKAPRSEPKSSYCPACDEEDELKKCDHCNMLLCWECVRRHIPLYREQLAEKVGDMLKHSQKVISNLSEGKELSALATEKKDHARTMLAKAEQYSINLIREKCKSLEQVIDTVHQENLAEVNTTKEVLGKSWEHLGAGCQELLGDLCNREKKLSVVKLRKIAEELSTATEEIRAMEQTSFVKCKKIDIVTDLVGLKQAVDQFVKATSSDSVIKESPEAYSFTPTDHTTVNVLEKDISKVEQVFRLRYHLLQSSNLQAVAVDGNNGDVFMTDRDNHQILHFDSTRKRVLCFGSQGSGPDQFDLPCDIAVNDQHQTIVCDKGNQRIKIHNSDGSLHSILGGKTDGDIRFSNPRSIALDSDGNIHVCDWEDNRVHVITQGGGILWSYDISGCIHARNICFAENGTVFVLSGHILGSNFITVFNQQYTQVRRWEILRGSSGLCIIGYHFLVCHARSNKIHVYDFNGFKVKEFDTNKHLYGKPRELATDKCSNIYVGCAYAVIQF